MQAKKGIMEAIVLLLISGLFILTFSWSTSPIYDKIAYDQAIFMLVGKGMVNGLVPYRDLLENKGPLFFLIEALPQFIMPGTLGIFILQIIVLFSECIIIGKIALILDFNNRYRYTLIGIFLFILMLFMNGGNLAEEYDVFFLILGMYIFIRNKVSEQANWNVSAFGLGVCTICICLIKMNDAAGLIAIDFFYIYELFHNTQKGKKFLKIILSGALGILIPLIGVLAYYAKNNAIQDMLYGYIVLNFKMVGEGGIKQAIIERLRLVFEWYGLFSVIPGTMAIISLIYALRKKKDTLFGCFTLIFVFFITLATFTHATGFRQHLIPLACSWVMCGICMGYYFKPLAQGKMQRSYMVLVFLLAIYGIIFLNRNMINSNAEEFISTDFAWNSEPEREFLDIIPKDEYDSVYGLRFDNGWYFRNDIFPKYKWLNLTSFISHWGVEISKNFERELMSEPAKWLITRGTIDVSCGFFSAEAGNFLRKNYKLVDNVDNKYLYVFCGEYLNE